MDLFTVSWSPEDHIDELAKILQDCPVLDAEKRFVEHVVDGIEPAGWRAKWKFDLLQNSFDEYNAILSNQEYIVDVLQVSMDKLEASVSIVSSVPDFIDNLKEDADKKESSKNQEILVKLHELVPLVQQENDTVDVARTAEIIELVRFFHQHILYPWDIEVDCCFDRETIEWRYTLYQKMTGELPGLPAGVSADMKRAKNEAWMVFHSIDKLETETKCNEGIIYENIVKELMELHQRLGNLKNKFEMLYDPIMREISSCHIFHSEPYRVEENSLDRSTGEESENRVWVVGGASNLTKLSSSMARIEEVVQQHQAGSCWPVTLAASLSGSIEACKAGDMIFLLPGRHQLLSLGVMAQGGGVICGVSKESVLVGTVTSGDVMMHISLSAGSKRNSNCKKIDANFSLRSLTIEPSCHHTTAIFVHSGQVSLTDVTISGQSSGGVVVSHCPNSNRGGECLLDRVNLDGHSGVGLECREGAKVTAKDTVVQNCSKGVSLSAKAITGLSSCSITNCSLAVEYSDEANEYSYDISAEKLLPSVFSEYEDVTLSDNSKDLLITNPKE